MDKDLKILTIEEMAQESVLWAWKPFIALGKITLVQGNPGVESQPSFSLSPPA